MKNIIYFVYFSVLSTSAIAVERSTKQSKVDRLITYSEFGNADVFVSLETNGETCSYGYYIGKDSPGYQSNLSMLLAAQISKTPVYIYAYESEKWKGNSNNTVCKIYAVEIK